MRRASKLLLALAVLAGCMLGTSNTTSAASGLTVTPATLNLSVVPDSNEQTAEFTVTNNYAAAVLVRFAFEPRLNAGAGVASPVNQLSISQPEVMLEAGKSVRQVVTVRDDNKLSPGSQLADLVITQVAAPSAAVGVQPSVRLPLVIIKQDGAIAGLSLSKLSFPKLSISAPHTLGATLHNKGNVIAIPRGFVTVSGPNGTVRQGALNTSSLAVSPGQDLALTTPLANLEGMWLPGFYRATISYGLGGDQAATTASSIFFYIAWWHIVGLLLIGFGMYHLVRHLRQSRRKKPGRAHHPPGRALLMRKGAA